MFPLWFRSLVKVVWDHSWSFAKGYFITIYLLTVVLVVWCSYKFSNRKIATRYDVEFFGLCLWWFGYVASVLDESLICRFAFWDHFDGASHCLSMFLLIVARVCFVESVFLMLKLSRYLTSMSWTCYLMGLVGGWKPPPTVSPPPPQFTCEWRSQLIGHGFYPIFINGL